MFVGVERYLGARVDGDKDESLRKRAGLVSEVRNKFASYNVLRAAARNCMWMGLVCLVISAMIHVNPFEELVPTMSSPARTCTFLSIWATLSGCAWFVFGSLDFKLQFVVSICGVLTTTTDMVFIRSGIPFERIVAFLILSVVVFIVPYTMSRFRMPLLDLVKKYSNVY
jgi:hypothetical protein